MSKGFKFDLGILLWEFVGSCGIFWFSFFSCKVIRIITFK